MMKWHPLWHTFWVFGPNEIQFEIHFSLVRGKRDTQRVFFVFFFCFLFPIKVLEDLHDGYRVVAVHLTLAPLIQVITSCQAGSWWESILGSHLIFNILPQLGVKKLYVLRIVDASHIGFHYNVKESNVWSAFDTY